MFNKFSAPSLIRFSFRRRASNSSSYRKVESSNTSLHLSLQHTCSLRSFPSSSAKEKISDPGSTEPFRVIEDAAVEGEEIFMLADDSVVRWLGIAKTAEWAWGNGYDKNVRNCRTGTVFFSAPKYSLVRTIFESQQWCIFSQVACANYARRSSDSCISSLCSV